MAPIDLHTLLELVGALNDNADKGSASERFRNYLRSYIVQPIDARAYDVLSFEVSEETS
jgi:hypothetical protein